MGKTGRVLRGAVATVVMLLAFTAAAVADPAGGQVDINQATADELIALPGIAEAKAQAIIDHREQEPFRSVEDLKKVRGIGEATFARLKDLVTVGEPLTAPR